MLTGCKNCYGHATDPPHELHTLSDQPCTTLTGTSCDACRSIITIEAEILDAQAALLRLIERHRTAREEMNMSHSSIHQRIPPEILSSIFRFCIPNNMEDNMLQHLSTPRRVETCMPYILGSVCRTWRSIAWSTPRLWNQVYLRFNSEKNALQSELLEKWLSRTGDLPLRIYADCIVKHSRQRTYRQRTSKEEIPQMDIISRYSSRWEDLYLCLPAECLDSLHAHSGTPLLRTLLLRPCVDYKNVKWQMPHTTPRNLFLDLRYMYDAQILHLGHYSFNVDWDMITELHIETNMPIMIEFAMNAENLRSLEITNPSSYIEPDTTGDDAPYPHDPLRFEEPLLSHSNIQQFKYRCLSNHPNHFMTFDFPAAVKVHIDITNAPIDEPSGIAKLISSLGHSPCLTWLTLNIGMYADGDIDLVHILHAAPSLEFLTLNYIHHSNLEFNLPKQLRNTAVANPNQFLPKLREISCTLGLKTIHWTDLLMVFGRLEEINDPGRRPLTSVVYVVSNRSSNLRDEDIGPSPNEVRTMTPYLRSLKTANLHLEARLDSNKNLLPWALIEQVESMAS
ncbi:hypothetical protein JR316_0013154 [Psilocybe cubensis]|uniref:Uncharacterized protein n=2 Tax=Psilocybe cubensis TaxID=181762 RepID=A0ACB8GGS5_PSICU|nr:hypothetical protein JR316_0013154 [Psilocybe cubensis]KAH9474689.1 hypothetical protein JR316_0013154 [Psilocybe cubensis]